MHSCSGFRFRDMRLRVQGSGFGEARPNIRSRAHWSALKVPTS